MAKQKPPRFATSAPSGQQASHPLARFCYGWKLQTRNECLTRLFETYLEIPVSRVLIASIAAQDDFMKRIRRNGGARDNLAPKGIAVLYSETDRNLMQQLGLSFGTREFVSYAPANSEETKLLHDAGYID